MNKVLICFALATGLVAPAMAQDTDYKDGATMTGFRADVRGGLDRQGLSLHADDGVDTVDYSNGTSGFGYGGEIGFDGRFGHTVIGVYGGFDLANTDYCEPVFGGDNACLEAGRNFTAGIRAGSQVSKNVLLFIKGGYSNGRLKASYTDAADPTNNFNEADNLDGFHAGVGGEVALGSNAYIKLEYVYSDYKDYKYSDPDVSLSLGLDRHQVLGGVGFRF